MSLGDIAKSKLVRNHSTWGREPRHPKHRVVFGLGLRGATRGGACGLHRLAGAPWRQRSSVAAFGDYVPRRTIGRSQSRSERKILRSERASP